MIDGATALSFTAAAILLALAPGPDNLFVLVQSAGSGARAGLLVTLGLCTGLLWHTAAVTVGVAALLAASPLAFLLIKVAGAAYLAWLALQAFRSGFVRIGQAAPLRGPQLYRRGVLMNVTNPKVTLFFLALLPQFADPERGAVAPQLLLLGGLFIAATLVVFGAIALLAGRLGSVLRRNPAAQRWLNRAAGLVFAGLALRLLVGR